MIQVLRHHQRQQAKERLLAWWCLRNHAHGPGARIWGKPAIEVRELVIGERLVLHSHYRPTRLAGGGKISLGDRVFINHGTWITSSLDVSIGDDVALSFDVVVMDSHGHGLEGGANTPKAVKIGSGSWVGARAIIMPGVTIGTRSVVAAGSVVTHDVDDDTVVAGVPARPVRKLHYPDGTKRAWTN